jgi:competence protein ComEC
LVDRTALSRDGATSLYRTSGGWSSHVSEQQGSNRPWDRRRETRPAAAGTAAGLSASPAGQPSALLDNETETERLQ